MIDCDPEWYFDFPEPTSPSKAHQIDALTERAEVAEGLVAQLKDELKRRNDDIEDWELRHINRSKNYAELTWMYQKLSR